MQLKNDFESLDFLDDCVLSYYRSRNRYVKNFLRSEDIDVGGVYSHFLVDRKHVLRFSLGTDRGIYLTNIQLGIGPHYFSPSEFWSFEDADRFKFDATLEAVAWNLSVLDEFLLS